MLLKLYEKFELLYKYAVLHVATSQRYRSLLHWSNSSTTAEL